MIAAARKKQLLTKLSQLSETHADIKEALDLTVGALCIEGAEESLRIDARRVLEMKLKEYMNPQDAFDTAKTVVEMIDHDGKDGGKAVSFTR